MTAAPGTAAAQPVLKAEGLVFGFKGSVALFHGLSFAIPPGVSWVRGGESRGKTTLLRLMAGELLPQAGMLQIEGTPSAQHQDAYRKKVFWTDPRTAAHDALTPVAYWETVQQRYATFDTELLNHLKQALQLETHQHKSLYMLSTGSKRKVWLAAAFAAGAALTLLDEPFAALDKASIRAVLDLLHEAATHPTRAWVVADYEAPPGLGLAAEVVLGD